MPKISMRQFASAGFAVLLILGLFLVDSSAQRRRRRHRSTAPRITNPAIYQPSPGDNTNSNTSGEPSNNENANADQTQKPSRSANEDPEAMKQTIRTLSSQVDRLTNKISQMEESQRSLVDLERLSRAEQHAASLRTELRDVQAKEADLQARAEDIDYALRPENIERSVAGYGTTHPEEVREQRRRQLESEKERIRKQLDQLASSRTRLEQAIATADTEIERLHKRLDAADEAAIQNAKTKAESEATSSSQSAPRVTPSPSPYPPLR
jgi:chromosome segregation ATPase